MKALPKNWLSLNKMFCLSFINQKALTCLLVLFVISGKGQTCSPTVTPAEIFYPNTVSTPTSNPGVQYLCGPNTVVYDTLDLGCRFVYMDNNTTLFLKPPGCLSINSVWIRSTGTLNILSGASPVSIVLEPGATINNPFGVSTSTIMCSSITFPIVNCSTDINENSYSSNRLKIYPNPVSNNLHIAFEKLFEQETQIEITNALGQTVLKSQYKNEIDVSQLTTGYYILKIINSDNQKFHSRFIKD